MRDTLKAEYGAILDDYLSGAGEAAVLRAYDFARKCLRGGLAPDDVMEFHIDLVDGTAAVAARGDARASAQNLLLEVIMAFSLGYRQTLEELEQSNRELARVSHFKSRMLSMVAHDLTNHMTAIKIFAGGIAARGEEPYAAYAGNILEVLREEEVLVSNLLDVGRIDTGRLQLAIVAQPLRAQIEQTVARISKASPRHTFCVTGDEVEVLADASKLQQVLENLIGNAVKYSPEGGAVDIALRVDESMARVEIRDQGMGIAGDDLPHVFEPFFRGSRAEHTAIRGTGLGLSIVRSLVLLQGGHIDAESEVGKGTMMRFTLPLAAAKNPSASPEIAAPATMTVVPRP